MFANGKAITRASITSRAPDAPLDPMIRPGIGQGWAIRRSDPYVGISAEWREPQQPAPGPTHLPEELRALMIAELIDEDQLPKKKGKKKK